MNHACVNEGGPPSILRLTESPRLEQEVALAAGASAALAAWRARPGEIVTLVAPHGDHYRARLTSLDSDRPRCVPFVRLASPTESPLRIEVFHALPDRERFELILEKLTELGVARIVPMETARSTTLVERDARQRKSHRWPELLRRAARQCRRAMLPELFAPLDLSAALALAARTELKLLLDADQAPWTLREGIAQLQPESVALLIGPEGGFTAEEVASAQHAGILPVRLGPRILRTETAAIAAVSLVQGLVGDLG
ncbi:MAG: RsmE family RNA methyltransferase [Desulfuromonadales bacterium]|nr:RsmE family RNA methyltransferase [Desulfuromonadales bacterium]